MNIHLQFYGQLRDIAGISKLNVDVREQATVAELLKKVYELRPALRAHDKHILIGAGVNFVERDHVLREGEEIAIMPPVQGG